MSAVARELGVEPERGLSVEEARRRLQSQGPNRLTGAKKELGFQAFLRQYRDVMQLILLVAAVVNLLVTGDVGTSIVLAGLTVFNAVIGLRQEAKAEESVKALAQMMKTVARVRRGGQALEIDAEELVPGDVVLMEAGNRVPADGRICVAATLEIEEAALTGESLPVAKGTDPVPGDEVALGDRTGMAYMNTSVTRGRGEMVVTATGMDTEIGHIADLLSKTETDKTPLQKQLDGLSKIIAAIAGVALVLVIVLGLIRGQSFDTLFITGVALAVAAIPTGLPAVVTALLSIGTREIARRNAIVKRLPAVETLGSTSVICSDKTGTLTLNKMTARELAIPGQHRFTVTGEGYSTDGEIRHVGGSHIDLELLARDQRNTVFSRAALPGPTQLRRYGLALLAIILVTTIGFLQRIFETTELRLSQWSICVGIAASLVVVEELIKLVIRRRDRRRVAAPAPRSLSGA